MKRVILLAVTIMLSAVLASAQDQPRPPRDGGGEGGGERQGPRGGGPGMSGPGMGGPGMGGPGQGGPPFPPMRPEMAKLEMLRTWLETVDRLTKLAHDPASAGVSAVVSASDILRQRGPEAAIAYFTKTLPEVKNETVQRAIRLQLIDLYKQSGQSDKALEQLDILIKGAPAGSVPATP